MKTLPLLALVLLAPKPMAAKVADVLKTPAKYDGKAVAVKGVVAKYQAKTSKAGRPYYKFDLVEGTQKLAVYDSDKLAKPLKDGDKVTVTGKYAHERKLGDQTFKDEIDASKHEDPAFGVK